MQNGHLPFPARRKETPTHLDHRDAFWGGEIAYYCKIVPLTSKDLLLPDLGHLSRAQSR